MENHCSVLSAHLKEFCNRKQKQGPKLIICAPEPFSNTEEELDFRNRPNNLEENEFNTMYVAKILFYIAVTIFTFAVMCAGYCLYKIWQYITQPRREGSRQGSMKQIPSEMDLNFCQRLDLYEMPNKEF